MELEEAFSTEPMNDLNMVEVKEEKEGETEETGQVKAEGEVQDDTQLSKESEDTMNNNSEKEEFVLKIETEGGSNLPEEEEGEEEEGVKVERVNEVQGMSPVETATLLLLSRIALFNKVSLLSSA